MSIADDLDELDAYIRASIPDVKFSARELCLLRRWNRHDVPPPELWPNMVALLDDVVMPIRRAWGMPLAVRSAWRPAAYNASDPLAAKDSRHLRFAAIDVAPPDDCDCCIRALQRLACHFVDGMTTVGIGLYSTRLHLDYGFRTRLTSWGSRRELLAEVQATWS